MTPPKRPPFIVSTSDFAEGTFRYPHSCEDMAPRIKLGALAGLVRIGLHLLRVPPGYRISWPHAEQLEEEFVYVVAGSVDAWIDGTLHAMHAGDLAAFPCGTGIAHTFINNTDTDATLFAGGEADKVDNRISYPLHPADLTPAQWWHDIPKRPQGAHDGLPDRLRDGRRRLD